MGYSPIYTFDDKGQDISDLVKVNHQGLFCKEMAKNCKLIRIKKSKHEILMEKDEVRNNALKYVDAFFLDNSQY